MKPQELYNTLARLVPDRFPAGAPEDGKGLNRVLWSGPFVVVAAGDESSRIAAGSLGVTTDPRSGDARIQFEPVGSRGHLYTPVDVTKGDTPGSIAITSGDPDMADIVIRPIDDTDGKFFLGKDMTAAETTAGIQKADIPC